MTRLKKLLISGLMAVVTMCVALSSAIVNVSQSIFSFVKAGASTEYQFSNKNSAANSRTNGLVISINGIPTSGKFNSESEPIKIPAQVSTANIDGTNASVSVVDDENIVVIIKNPLGVQIKTTDANSQLSYDSANKVYNLVAKQTGYYTVQYAVKDGNVWTLSDIYSIKIVKDTYSAEFADNSQIIVPSKIDTNKNRNTSIALDLPLFYNSQNELITSFVLGKQDNEYSFVAEYVTKTVYFDTNNQAVEITNETPEEDYLDKNIFENYSYYTVKKVLNANVNTEYGLLIETKIPGEELKTNVDTLTTENSLKLKNVSEMNENDVQNYVNVAYEFIANSGKNIINYKLCKKTLTSADAESPFINKNVEINGSVSNDSSKMILNVKATAVKDSSADSKVSINKKQYLPAVEAYDSANDNATLDAYYSYTVKYDDGSVDGSTSSEYVEMGYDEDGLYFIPKVKGEYTITYSANGFYDYRGENNQSSFSYSINVTDKTPPTMALVDSYNYESPEQDIISTDFSYVIPSTIYIDRNDDSTWDIEIPAVYTTDNDSSYSSNFVVTRKISGSNFLYSQEDAGVNSSYTGFYIQNSSGKTEDIKQYVSSDNNESSNLDLVKFNDFATDFSENNNENLLMKQKTSQTATLTINPNFFGEGEYSVVYTAKDATGLTNTTTTKTYTFNVVYIEDGVSADSENPTVDFGSQGIDKVGATQQITLSKPTIKDNVDKNLKVEYYILVNSKQLNLNLNDENKISFNMDDEIEGDSIYDLASLDNNKFKVYAKATDDNGNVGTGFYEIEIDVQDLEAPVIENIYGTEEEYTNTNKYEQYGIAKVNGIVFYDNSSDVDLNVRIFDSEGNEYAYETILGDGLKITEGNFSVNSNNYKYKYEFSGVSFNVSKADNYTVNYVLTDKGNNVTAFSFMLVEAKDKQAPVISGITGNSGSVEIGESFILENVSATDNTDGTISYALLCTDENGLVKPYATYANGKIKFTPKQIGNYNITLTAIDEDGNKSSRTFVVKAQDTLKPEIILTNKSEDIISLNEDENKGNTNFNGETINWSLKSNVVLPEIVLPSFSVLDANQDKVGFNGILGATGTLTIKTPDSDTYTINLNEDKGTGLNLERFLQEGNIYAYRFIPTTRGTYTATYSATDYNGNSAQSQVITIYVGDTEDPVIELTENFEKTLNKGFVLGSNAILDIDSVVTIKEVEDNEKFYYLNGTSNFFVLSDNFGFKTPVVNTTASHGNYDYKMSIQVLDENNNTVYTDDESPANHYVYTFKTAGTYTITFTATDSVGNVFAKTKTFTVAAQETSESNTTKVLGIILIALSALILVGAVIYLVKGTKLFSKKRKTKKIKEEKVEETAQKND